MNQLKDKVINGRNIKHSTWKSYLTNIKQLLTKFNDGEYKNNKFLHNRKDLKEYLATLKPAKQRMVISTILVLLSPCGKNQPENEDKSLYHFYTSLLATRMDDYFNEQQEQLANPKQLSNWRSWEDILGVQRRLMNTIRRDKYNVKNTLTQDESKKLQEYLVLSLYTLIPPRRLDYSTMTIVDAKTYRDMNEKEKNACNYLVCQSRVKKYFSFGEDSQKNKTFYYTKVPPKLNQILNLYLKHHNHCFLLVNSRGGQLSKDGLSKQLMRVLEKDGKRLSVNMLRHIYLSDKFKDAPSIKERQLLALEMGHSSTIAEHVYTKKN